MNELLKIGYVKEASNKQTYILYNSNYMFRIGISKKKVNEWLPGLGGQKREWRVSQGTELLLRGTEVL